MQALYEWVTAAQWTQQEFERERGVVLKEMSRSDNNIRRQIYYNVQERYYKDSPYRYPVIGYRDRFLQITSEQLKYYYKSTYVAENFIVVVGGNVSHQSVLDQINKTFGLLPMIPLNSGIIQVNFGSFHPLKNMWFYQKLAHSELLFAIQFHRFFTKMCILWIFLLIFWEQGSNL